MNDAPPREPAVLLTLAVPAALEDELIDALRDLPEHVTGFTMLLAEGWGQHLHFATALEQVRGRARRRLFLVFLPEDSVAPVIARLRERFPSPEIRWWTSPLSAVGSFAP